MTNTSTGVEFTVYSNVITQYGDDVVRYPATFTYSNIEGDETVTYGATASLRAYIVRKARPWTFDKAGMIEGGDGLMLVKAADTITRLDKVTWNGNSYRVQTVLNRDNIGGTVAYKVCNLFLI